MLRLFKKPKEIPSPDNEFIKGNIDAMPTVSKKKLRLLKRKVYKI